MKIRIELYSLSPVIAFLTSPFYLIRPTKENPDSEFLDVYIRVLHP